MLKDNQLETSTLAMLVHNPELIKLAGLELEDFDNHYHREVYKTLTTMDIEGTKIAIPTLQIELEKNNVTGAKSLVKLMTSIDPDAYNVELLPEYVKELKELRGKRELRISLNEGGSIDKVFNKVKQIELRLTETKVKDLEECFFDYMSEYKERKNHKIGIDTGFKMIDELAPMEAGTLNILAARSSIGKSALALNMAYNAASAGHKVLFVSAEMSICRLLDRLFALMTGVEAWKFRKSNADNSMQNLSELVKEFKKHLQFIYVPYGTSLDICRIIKKETMKEKKDLVVVDYLQYLRDAKKGGENGAERIGNMTRNFKGIAGECNLALLVLSQVNRQSAMEEDGRPKLHQLRDSGSIEQDADSVMMLNRVDKESVSGTLDILKNRNGQADVCIKLSFNPRTTKFSEIPKQDMPANYKEINF